MAPKHRGLTPPQREILPGMPATPYLEVQLGKRISLSHALRFDFLGMRPEDYADVTGEQVRLIAADQLRPSSIDVGREAHGALGYFDPTTRRSVFIASTTQEHGLLNPSIRGLGERAMSVTENARKLSPSPLADVTAPARAGMHAIDRRADRIERLIYNQLLPEQDLLMRFRTMADHPGYAHLTEEDMRLQLTTVLSGSFGNLLEAVGRTRGWYQQPEKARRARRALDVSLTLDRFGNQNLTNFANMLELAHDRNGFILAIARDRLQQTKEYRKKHAPDVSKF